MKKGVGIFIIIAVIVAGFLIYNLRSDKTSLQDNTVNRNTVITADSQSNMVEITSSGFSPQTLNINQGDKVTFVNKDSNPHWPASAMHPTHTVYPGSDIKKCDTAEQPIIFDSCRGLKQGEEWSFTFNEKGNWNYHDHIAAGLRGTIIVN
ncbi:MAG: plastocyanin/azurin family copper-binding protein [Nanoarchaeota archaeon]